MTLPIYLAMTAEELRSCLSLPENIAYMACHYAPYGTGLANLPEQFSQDMLLILNDRIPPTVHDPQLIIEQLTDIAPSQILLDFQQPDMPINHAVTQLIAQNTSVSVCCSQPYGNGLSCAVAVELPPPHLPLDQHLAPWSGREIWLDLDISAYIYTVTTDGCKIQKTNTFNDNLPFEDSRLHCHYKIDKTPDSVIFTLQRTDEDLTALLNEAKEIGVKKAFGLYQQLVNFKRLFPQ